MSLQKGKRRKQRPDTSHSVISEQRSYRFNWVFPFTLGAILFGGGVFLTNSGNSSESSQSSTPLTQVSSSSQNRLPTLGDLSSMTDEQLSKLDIAVLNLRCAEGLPGADKLDIQKCRRQLDSWAAKVKFETDRHLYRVTDPRYAEHYRNSEPYFRASMMLQVLQEDCQVHYNHDRIRDVDFTNSKDLFIHGMIDSENGGTCVSMPVLYTAIGRRLGYPIKLVLAKQHVFCRWDSGDVKLNIEGSGEGFESYSNEHYMKWPIPITEQQVKAGIYLRSLTPREELAVFQEARGYCFEDLGRLDESYVAYSQANQLAPRIPQYEDHLIMAIRKQHHAKLLAAVGGSRTTKPVRHNPTYAQNNQQGFNQTTQPVPHQTGYRGPQGWNPDQHQYSHPATHQPTGHSTLNQNQGFPTGFPRY